MWNVIPGKNEPSPPDKNFMVIHSRYARGKRLHEIVEISPIVVLGENKWWTIRVIISLHHGGESKLNDPIEFFRVAVSTANSESYIWNLIIVGNTEQYCHCHDTGQSVAVSSSSLSSTFLDFWDLECTVLGSKGEVVQWFTNTTHLSRTCYPSSLVYRSVTTDAHLVYLATKCCRRRSTWRWWRGRRRWGEADVRLYLGELVVLVASESVEHLFLCGLFSNSILCTISSRKMIFKRDD